MEKQTIIIIVVVILLSSCISSSIYFFTGDSSSPAPSPPAKSASSPPQSTPPPPQFQWKCLPGINVPLRKNAQGDVECMSQNTKDCLWKANPTECNQLLVSPPGNLQPLVCGEMHKKHWGGTGYDVPDHWCAKAKSQL